MARRKQKNRKQDETLVDLVETKEHFEDFFERNQTMVLSVLTGIVLLIGGYLTYVNFVQGPKVAEAAEQMTMAQTQFEKDSFALALSNPGGGFDGFLGIMDNYGGTPSANLAKYYAGICYLNIGDYDSAIEYLNKFSAEGDVLPIMKQAAIADAYSEKKDFDNAASYYAKAIAAGDNEMLTAFYMKRLAELKEFTGDTEGAIAMYKSLKKKYPGSQDARNIDMYITKLEQ